MSTQDTTPTQDTATFLAQSIVQEGLNIEAIKAQLAEGRATEKDAFRQAVRLSESIATACQWFNSAEGKTQRETDGIQWKQYDMTREVFGLGKTQSAQYVKVAKLIEENDKLLSDYETFVKLQKDADELEQYGLKGLVRYAKDEQSGDDEDKPEVEASFKFGDVSGKFYSDGVVDLGKNSTADVENALLYMLEEVRKVNYESGHESKVA